MPSRFEPLIPPFIDFPSKEYLNENFDSSRSSFSLKCLKSKVNNESLNNNKIRIFCEQFSNNLIKPFLTVVLEKMIFRLPTTEPTFELLKFHDKF